MPDTAPHPEIDPDEALRLLEESLSYYTPVPRRKSDLPQYEDIPLAA